MRTKRILAKIIAITFALVVLFACAGIFSVKKVEVSFAVSNFDTQGSQLILDGFKGKNLLFLDKKEVFDSLSSKPYLQIESVEKKYPNVLSVSVKERRETYKLEVDDKTYILDENGFVLNDDGQIRQSGSVIDLSFITFRNTPQSTLKIEVSDITLGRKIKTTNDEAVYRTFEIAKEFGLFDCITSVTIEDCTGGEYDVSFETHTGVKIYICDVLVDGARKGQVGLEIYNTIANDYQKRFGLLETRYVVVNGEIKLVVDHTYDELDAPNRNDFRLYEQVI